MQSTRPSPRRPCSLVLRCIAASLLLGTAAHAVPDQPAWITRSNVNAQVLVSAMAKLSPEFAGRIGVRGFDDKIADLTAGNDERARVMFTAARDELVQRATVETDPLVHQDLEILIKAASPSPTRTFPSSCSSASSACSTTRSTPRAGPPPSRA
jgi:hypothetical protein